MAVPSSNIDFSDLQTEFGGSSPISLTEYYRGGAYVPNITANAAVPTSGAISLSQFAGATNEASAQELLDSFWTERASLFRIGTEVYGSTYPGTGPYYQNNPQNRYLSSAYTDCTYTNSGLTTYSPYTTAVLMACGSSANITGFSANVSGTNYWSSTWGETSIMLVHFDYPITDITSLRMNFTRSSGNSGCWSKVALIPGKWAFSSEVQNPTANSGSNYVRTLPSGRFSVFMSGAGADGSTYNSYSGTNAFTGSQWWYNSTAYYIAVNNTGSAQTQTWAASGGCFDYTRRVVEFVKL